MATLELSTLWDKLEDDELRSLLKAYEQTDGGPLDIDEVAEQAVLDNGIDDDMFSDFLDKLEANEAAADIYLPTDFEEIFEVGDLRIGSSHALLLVLETLREDFAAEEEEDDGDEGDEVATEDEEPEVFEDDESLDLDDDDDDDDPEALYAGDDESPVEIKEEVLRHIWKLMYQGAKASIRRGLCLFVHG